MITLKNVSFDYQTFKKQPGLMGTIHDLFKRQVVSKRALTKLNLTIHDGELIGLIGPNGAGKTTLTKLLTGIIQPTVGKITVDGQRPASHQKALLREIGVMFGQKSQLSWNLPPIDTLNMLAAIYGLDATQYHTRLRQLVELLAVQDLINIPVRKLSLGQRVRCELLCSLIHSPKYLFLDEPTLGLDIMTQEKIYQFLRTENQRYHTTIILTSHNLQDIEAVSQRLLILAQGKFIFDGTLADLPVDLKQSRTFIIKYVNQAGQNQQITVPLTQLATSLKKIDQQHLISVTRQGLSLNDLILTLYQTWSR